MYKFRTNTANGAASSSKKKQKNKRKKQQQPMQAIPATPAPLLLSPPPTKATYASQTKKTLPPTLVVPMTQTFVQLDDNYSRVYHCNAAGEYNCSAFLLFNHQPSVRPRFCGPKPISPTCQTTRTTTHTTPDLGNPKKIKLIQKISFKSICVSKILKTMHSLPFKLCERESNP